MIRELETPAFLVDIDRVQRNCDAMRTKAERSGVAFRPHVKTHKVPAIARLQWGGSAGPITVSTLAEAEDFAAAGFRDITYGVPIAPARIARAAVLMRGGTRINLLLDSAVALQAVEEASTAHELAFDVFLKIDCGYHRAGVDPASADSLRLALQIARSPATRFRGLLTHAGHSYNAATTDGIRAIAAEEKASLTRFAERLAAEGIRDLVRSIGSTPTCMIAESFEGCDEVRPGNYVFFDAFQAKLGSCTMDDVAVSVLTTVVGCYPDRHELIVDAGALAMSKDLSPAHLDPESGFGVICSLDGTTQPLELTGLSQEHGKVLVKGDASRWPVGTRLRIVPNHSCLTAAMFEHYAIMRGDEVIDQWKPVRGW